MSNSVLLVDDSESHCQSLLAVLKSLGIDYVDYCLDTASAQSKLACNPDAWDAIFVSLHTQGIEFFYFLSHLKYRGGVVILSPVEDTLSAFAIEMVAPCQLRILGSLAKPFEESSVAFLIKRLHNCHSLRSSETTNVLRRSQVENALQHKRLVPYFQPVIDYNEQSLFSLECLIRLDIEGLGTVLPSAFLSVAERFNLLNNMTMSMLNSVLPQYRYFMNRTGQQCQLSINLASQQLNDESVPEQFYDCVISHKVKPSQIVFEVTENDPERSPAQQACTNRLRALDFGLALGEYGTGYTDVRKIDPAAYTQVKLDKQMIEGVVHDKVLDTVVKTALKHTQALGLPLIAVGVERETDLNALSAIGLRYFQGYIFCRPKPLGELIRWYGTWNLMNRSGGFRSPHP